MVGRHPHHGVTGVVHELGDVNGRQVGAVRGLRGGVGGGGHAGAGAALELPQAVGPERYCSPRHVMPANSMTCAGSKCGGSNMWSMTSSNADSTQ